MTELIMKLNRHFTEAEKEECKPIIRKLVDLANIARRQGILALEREMADEKSVFLKTAISLVVDGTDPVLIKSIVTNIILSNGYSGAELLGRLIMAEGVLSLQRGENPTIITMKLGAMLGEKYIAQIMAELTEDKTADYFKFLSTLRGRRALPECERFESEFMQLDNRSIQLILRNTSQPCLLAALQGCGYELIMRIFDNISTHMCLSLIEGWVCASKESRIWFMKCQEQIMDTKTRLEGDNR